MQITVRSDSVLIDGYVNAVERDSKVLHGRSGQFIERIAAGAFARALGRAKATGRPVKVLLNHNYDRELTSTAENTTQLREDNIGLRCTCEIRDAEVVEKARNKELRGWSFGFVALNTSEEDRDNMTHRDVRDLDLIEVSILDSTKIPAYTGTSIEAREDDEDYIQTREDESVEYLAIEERKEPDVDLHDYLNRFNATRMA